MVHSKLALVLLLLPRSTLQWHHNERDGISKHQPHDCLLNHLFRPRSKKTSKFRITGLGEGNSLVTGEFPSQSVSNVENVSIGWRLHDVLISPTFNIIDFFKTIEHVIGSINLTLWPLGDLNVNFRWVIFKQINSWGICYEYALMWLSLDLTDDL